MKEGKKMILIIDDDHEFAEILREELESYYIDKTIKILKDFNEEFLTDNDVEILFLDIELENGKNGIDLAKEYRAAGNDELEIVFISSHENYVHNSFVAFPLYFIRKARLKEDLYKCIRILDEIKRKKEMPLFMGEHIVKLTDVLYIESRRNNVFYNLKDGSKIKRRAKISEVEEELKNYNFVRCHQSYVVNIVQVKEYYPYESITLKNGKVIPSTQKYHRQILDGFRNKFSRKWSKM